jgi:hypothetical protein
MERIAIEVDKRLAIAWRKASEKKKKEIGNWLNIFLAKELNSQSGIAESGHLCFLNELREEMAANGPTKEELNKIMNYE